MKVFAVSLKETVPPREGLRSSHSPAIRGWSPSISPADSVKSTSPEPKVRLPLELTKTELKLWPQMVNSKGMKISSKSSSPSGISPGPAPLKMMSALKVLP
ncbi:MAG: hypothetical protein GTO30_09920, partial [Acidobacteria bacterium]|nr:hypothetical protein [Acidobacteriota bacterium]